MSHKKNITVTGNEAYFNEDVKFFKDVYIDGDLSFNFKKKNPIEFSNVIIYENLEVFGIGTFHSDVSIENNASIAGILTVKKRLDVGVGGTTLRADAETGRVGIGTTIARKTLDVIGTAIFSERIGIGSAEPQQTVDVAGNIKIDGNIYDSSNNPAQNGYSLVRDERGIRWIPLVAESRPEFPGITTDGIFVLNEMVPLYPS